MGRQQEFNFTYGVTKEQACIMCHLSSECEGCCLKCRKCQGQICSQTSREWDGQRWDTWMYLVNTRLPELRRFVPEKWLKEWKKHNRN